MNHPTISKDETWFLQRRAVKGWYGVAVITAAPLPSKKMMAQMALNVSAYCELDIELFYADDVGLINNLIGDSETLYMRAIHKGRHVGGARITLHGRTMLADDLHHKLFARVVAVGKFP